MNTIESIVGLDRPEFEKLHPKQRENCAAARETILEMVELMSGHHISDIGVSDARKDGISEAFYAALDQTGEKAHDLGYQPTVLRIGPRRDRYEVPSPVLIAIQSSTSQSGALVLVTFNSFNPVNGWGDWADVTMNVAGIFDSLDEAKKFQARVAQAFGILENAVRDMDKMNQAGTTGKVLAF